MEYHWLIFDVAQFGFEVMHGNSISDCKAQFKNTDNETNGYKFCDCVHPNEATLQHSLMNMKD